MREIREQYENEIVEKKSRFIATVKPVQNVDEANEFFKSMKKKYYNARHNCTAFIVGEDGEIKRSSDDGEPGGTAGRPMLEVLEGADLTGVAAVVTRYFGGVLLGTGGLVRAYSSALKGALEKAEYFDIIKGTVIEVICDYSNVNQVLKLAAEMKLKEEESSYMENVSLKFFIPDELLESFVKKLKDVTLGKASLRRKDGH